MTMSMFVFEWRQFRLDKFVKCLLTIQRIGLTLAIFSITFLFLRVRKFHNKQRLLLMRCFYFNYESVILYRTIFQC